MRLPPHERGRARASQRPPHSFGRIGELLLQPCAKRFLEEPLGLVLGENAEQRIDAGFHGTLAQELGAEAVNRADVRLLELSKGVVQPLSRFGLLGRGALALERLAKAQLQLARGLFGERDRHDVLHLGASGGQNAQDPVDELGRLARTGCCFDDKRVVERGGDEIACFRVDEFHGTEPASEVMTDARDLARRTQRTQRPAFNAERAACGDTVRSPRPAFGRPQRGHEIRKYKRPLNPAPLVFAGLATSCRAQRDVANAPRSLRLCVLRARSLPSVITSEAGSLP